MSENHYERLRSGQRETIATSSMHLDLLRDLRHINSHLTSAAFPILERAGELRDTRLRAAASRRGEAGDDSAARDAARAETKGADDGDRPA